MNSQIAITLLKDLEQSLDDYCELNDEGKTAFSMAITALELFGISEQLPSVQPEIIRCKDCKWWEKLHSRCDLFQMYQTEEWYCANAELREEQHD